jgi:hypothetical protein
MPVAARKRTMAFLSAAMRLPVARNWRTSASTPFELAGLLTNVFTWLNCHKPVPDTTGLFLDFPMPKDIRIGVSAEPFEQPKMRRSADAPLRNDGEISCNVPAVRLYKQVK